MCLNGFVNLFPFEQIFIYVPNRLAQSYFFRIRELNVLIVRGTVDAGNDIIGTFKVIISIRLFAIA